MISEGNTHLNASLLLMFKGTLKPMSPDWLAKLAMYKSFSPSGYEPVTTMIHDVSAGGGGHTLCNVGQV
jgi:hypothetical protein